MWQPTSILFPDVELLLTTRLRAILAARPESYAKTAFVSNSIPATRRDQMVIVRHDGGPTLGDVRAAARVGINVFGATPQQASDLARLVAAVVGGLAGADSITAVPSVSLPSEVADPSGQARRYLTAELHVRGSVLS